MEHGRARTRRSRNGVGVASARGGEADDSSASFLAVSDLENLPLKRSPHRPLLKRIWELRNGVTPYDAAYVALAEALDVVLVTADARLARAPAIRCEIEAIAGPDPAR